MTKRRPRADDRGFTDEDVERGREAMVARSPSGKVVRSTDMAEAIRDALEREAKRREARRRANRRRSAA